MPINELRAIETFAKAVELGSLRRAAAAQGVSPQAASQTVAQLEQHLGVRLPHRTTRSLAVTDEGRRLLEATQPALAAIGRALQAVRESKDEIAGPIHIIGPKSAFAPVLMPVVNEFCRRYPDVQPDVQLDDGIGDWVLDRVDVGFRIGGVPQEGLFARKLFPVQLIVCAAPGYVREHGVPRTLDELANHRCSAFRHPVTQQIMPWYLKVNGEVVQRHVAPAFSTNDIESELQAVVAGRVIAQVSAMSAAAFIRRGELVPLLLDHVTDHMSVHLYYGTRSAQPRRVRAFIDLAVEMLADNADLVLTPRELGTKRATVRTRAAKT